MATIITTAELRNMSAQDLQREVRVQRTRIEKMHLHVQMQTEKDTAKFQREKRQLSRLLTVLREKDSQETKHSTPLRPGDTKDSKDKLNTKPKTANVGARKTSKPS